MEEVEKMDAMEKMEEYARKNYYNEKLYPSTKLLLGIVLSLTSFLIPLNGAGYIIMLFCILLSLITGVFKEYISQFIKVILPIIIILFIFQLIIVSGEEVLFSIGFISITREAVDAAIAYSSNIGAIATSITLVFQMTSTNLIIKSLENTNLPKNAVFVISSTLQFLPQAKEQSNTIKEAQQSRGLETEGSIVTKIKSFVPMIIPLALSTISSNEERVLTLESRGFSSDKKRTGLYRSKKTQLDNYVQILLIASLISLIIWRVFIWR